jgi:hypothetical protein
MRPSFVCRPVFRVLAILVSVPVICLGGLGLFDYVRGVHVEPSSMKFVIASLALGLLFLVVGIRGRLIK